MAKKLPNKTPAKAVAAPEAGYADIVDGIVDLLEAARRASARSVNAIMTATYWEIGRRIVEHEQAGERRATYGSEMLKRLSADLSERFGRGFSRANLEYMRRFYLTWPISQTLSGESSEMDSNTPHSKSQTVSGISGAVAQRFPLPWSHYIRLLAVKKDAARHFYEAEALRGGWSIRQLERQIGTQFYERTLLSRKKSTMLSKGQLSREEDRVTPDEEVKDPYILEFLNLKDEYSESELEAALIQHLETFLMELGGDFAFVSRQRRLRIEDEWFRVDLLLFHRRLRCLVIIDLKLDKFSYADAGQMHMYLNYAREHWTVDGENPPIGIILCASKNETLVKYALDGLPNRVIAAEYRTVLPSENDLVAEIEETRRRIESRSKDR